MSAPDPENTALELELLSAQAREAATNGFAFETAQTLFYLAMAQHLNDLSRRLRAGNIITMEH